MAIRSTFKVTRHPDIDVLLNAEVSDAAGFVGNFETQVTTDGAAKSVPHGVAIIATGADKVSTNTAAVRDPDLITQGARAFGSNAIVIAIDARRRLDTSSLAWETTTHGGRRRTGLDAVEWAREGNV